MEKDDKKDTVNFYFILGVRIISFLALLFLGYKDFIMKEIEPPISNIVYAAIFLVVIFGDSLDDVINKFKK